MRHAIALMIVAAFVAGSSAVLHAQGKSHRPKTTATHGPKTGHHAPKTVRAPKATAHQGPKTTTARGPKTTTTARGPKTTKTTHGPKSTTAGTPKSGKPATTKAGQANATNLPRNTRQVDRLRTLLQLPAGTDLTPYAAGFKNQGQFVAAVNVSNNLGISFTELKAIMVPDGINQTASLGQAIQRLRPNADADAEVRRATGSRH
jgi:hypothetical protein